MDILDMIAAAPRVFMSITIPDVIDIILLTLLLIAVIRFMSETRATQLLKGIGLIALLYLLVWLGQLKVMTYLFQNFFLQWGLVAIVVVFQPEIRRLLEKVGTTAKVRIPFLAYFEKADAQKVIERDTAITAISDACERLMFCLFSLLPIVLYALLVCMDSTVQNRSFRIGIYSVAASFIQLIGYGSGFWRAWWQRCILKRGEFEAFRKNFYK